MPAAVGMCRQKYMWLSANAVSTRTDRQIAAKLQFVCLRTNRYIVGYLLGYNAV
jgi:hypothetical protein